MSEEKNDLYKIRGTKVYTPYPVRLTPAETRLVFSLERHFLPEQILVDVYLPRPALVESELFAKIPVEYGGLTQIDVVAVNELGIFVIESKDLSGWLYGDEQQEYWTQVLDYGREKHSFYNPFLQNTLHVKAMRELLGDELPILSVVVFGNNAEVKTLKKSPSGHFYGFQSGIHELMKSIEQKSNPKLKLSPEKIVEICDIVRRGRIIPDARTIATHIDEATYAKNRHLAHKKPRV